MTSQSRFERLIESAKWPATAILLALSPLVLYGIGRWILRFPQFPLYSVMFFLGAGCVVALCRTKLISSPWIRQCIQWERNFTQTLFAYALMLPWSQWSQKTSEDPSSLPFEADSLQTDPSPTIRRPARWLGKGNWLMLCSPYCFPAASILLWLVSWFLLAPLRSFAIGFGVAYHVASVILQWHFGTNELRRLGDRFCTLFLIPANLIVVGTGYAFALNGFEGLFQFAQDVLEPIRLAFQWLKSFNSEASA